MEKKRGDTDAQRHLALVALAALGAVCSSVDVWFLMTSLFPAFLNLWAPGVTLQALAAAAGYALVALAGLRAPHCVRPLPLSLGSGLLIVLGTATWGGGMAAGSAALATVGACVAHFACSWARILVGVALCALGNRRDLVVAAVLGEAVGALVRCVVPPLGPAATLALVCATEVAMLVAGHVAGAPYLRRVLGGDDAAGLDTTNPGSFLSPSHKLFVLIAFFEFIHGISLAERTTEVAWATNAMVAAFLVGLGAWLVARRAVPHEDTLLSIAALFMLGGFILRPLTPFEAVASSALSFAGAATSWVMIWIVFASVGMANPVGVLWALGAGYTMQALGLEAGSVLGRLASDSFGANGSIANVVNALVVVAFIGYLLVALRGFSFSATFADIVPAAPPTRTADPDELVRANCRALGARCGLSERELEVAVLLAQGRSGQEIQDALTVSRNTVKTHVRHIYRKLGVHAQQELIDLVAKG